MSDDFRGAEPPGSLQKGKGPAVVTGGTDGWRHWFTLFLQLCDETASDKMLSDIKDNPN